MNKHDMHWSGFKFYIFSPLEFWMLFHGLGSRHFSEGFVELNLVVMNLSLGGFHYSPQTFCFFLSTADEKQIETWNTNI